MSAAKPMVVCIVLNWNGWKDTVECLDALQACTYEGLLVVVVDNGSTDESVSRIRAAHPTLKLIESAKNLGFAGGNNLGIRYALGIGADYIWLLNNDTQPFSDSLSALIAKIQTDQHFGAVSSICFFSDAPDQVQVWGGARVNLWIGVARNSVLAHPDKWFDALYGASLLISAQALNDVGLLDEGFFLYWEETEFCLRLRKHGWKLAAAPDSRVLHKVGSSSKGNRGVVGRYVTTSGLRLLKLHSPIPLLSMIIFVVLRLLNRALQFEFSQIKSVHAGILDYLEQRPVVQRIR